MVRCCVRGENSAGDRDDGADWTVAATGSAIAVACLACVGWSLMHHDRGVQSELVAEGASQVIDPAEPKSFRRAPAAALPRRILTLDRGEHAAAMPVVNAHLEIVSDGKSSQAIDVSSMVRSLHLEQSPSDAVDASAESSSAEDSKGKLPDRTTERPRRLFDRR